MNKMHAFVCATAICCCAASLHAAETTDGSDQNLSSAQTVNVASGDTLIWTGSITGGGTLTKTGAGTLVIRHDNAETFSGPVVVAGGVVQVEASNALGTGLVTMGGGQVCFNAANATFPNAFTATTASAPTVDTSSAVYSYGAHLFFKKNTTLTGDITTDNVTFYVNCERLGVSAYSDSWCQATFNGEINVGTANFAMPGNGCYGKFVFNKKVTCKEFQMGSVWSACGKITFNAENAIGYFPVDSALVHLNHTNALKGARFSFIRAWSSDRGMCYLKKPHHVMKSLDANSDRTGDNAPVSSDKTGVQIHADTASVLELTGEATSRTTYARLTGPLTFVLDAKDYPDYTQTFDCVTSATTGDIIVSNGTLRIIKGAGFPKAPRLVVAEGGRFVMDATTSDALVSVTDLQVDGQFTMTAGRTNPFRSDGCLNVTLGAAENALSLPGVQFSVNSLTVAGVTKRSGTYTHANLPQLADGTTLIVAASSDDMRKYGWKGQGASASVQAAANWASDPGDDVTPEILAGGTLYPLFATAGTEAIVDTACFFAGVRFSAPNDFTLRRAQGGSLIIGDKCISVLDAVDAPARRYTFEVPFDITCDQTWPVSANATLAFDSALDTDFGGKFTVNESGRVEMLGTNRFDGALVVNNGAGAIFKGYVGPKTANLDQGDASFGGAHTVTVNTKLLKQDTDNTRLIFDGVDFNKPLAAKWPEANSDDRYATMTMVAGTTNVFRQPVYTKGQNCYVRMGKGATVIFEGKITAGSFAGSKSGSDNSGTLVYSEKAGAAGSSFENLYSRYGTNVYACVGASVSGRFCVDGDNGYGVFMADNVFKPANAANFVLGDYWRGGQPHGVIDFNGTRQTWPRLLAETAGGYANRAEITTPADKPAVLAITGVQSAASTNTANITGPVTIEKSGDQAFYTFMRHVQTTGDLNISGGLFDIASNSSYTNVPNVRLSGTAKLGLHADKQLNRKVNLSVADGAKISIPEGVMVVVGQLYINGAEVPVPYGTYGGAESPAECKDYAQYFEGKGILRAGRGGVTLILR